MRARVLAVAGLALAFAPAASSARPWQRRGHLAEDSVHNATAEPRMSKHTRTTVTAADARSAAAAVAGDEHLVGRWGPVAEWPVVGVHNALMPDGRVLAFDSVGDNATETYPVHDHTRATLWDPTTGAQTPVWVETGYNVFCAGFAHLADGRLFLAGGNLDSQLRGIRQTHIFDPSTNTWSVGPDMAAGRWYPTGKRTPLRNGEMLITSGGPSMPEVRTTSGSLRALSSASLGQPLYPWIDVAPDGRAFVSGPDQTMRSLDTSGTGAWQTHGQRDGINRDYGSHALYDIGKVLVAGGGASSKDARVIDVNGTTPQVTQTAPMANGRRQHNLTVLADGSVLATGGNSSRAGLVGPRQRRLRGGALEPGHRRLDDAGCRVGRSPVPLDRPAARGRACAVVRRRHLRYLRPGPLSGQERAGLHATAPVPDRRVGANSPSGRRSLPRRRPRPTACRSIDTPQAASIAKVALVRLGAVTHSVNMEQRYVPLSYTSGAGSLTATAPANANIAPPGVYMLFVVDAAGVPSVAKMVTVTGNSAPSVSLTAPANGESSTRRRRSRSLRAPRMTAASPRWRPRRRDQARRGRQRSVHVRLGGRSGGEPLDHRGGDGQPGRADHEQRADGHGLEQRAERDPHGAGQRRLLPRSRDDPDRGERLRRRRHHRGRVLRRRQQARRGHERSVHVRLDQRAGRQLLDHRAGDGHPRRADHQQPAHGHGRGDQPRAEHLDHVAGRGHVVPLERPGHHQRHGQRPGRHDRPRGVLPGRSTTLLGTDASAPYSYRWKDPPAGTHLLRAKAYDNRGAVTTSAAVSIAVRAR